MRRLLATLVLAACTAPPGGPVLTVDPPNPTTTDVVRVTVAPSPADRAAPDRYEFAWFVDGEPQPDLDADLLTPDRTRRGQAWRIVVTPFLRATRGTPSYTFAIIENSLPELALTWAEPAPHQGDDLVVRPTVTDADDDPIELRYRWTRDGAPTTLQGDTVPADETTRGETWQVTVTAADPEGEAAPVTAEIVVGNDPPQLASVDLSPSNANISAPITADHPEPTDLEGDPIALRYRWLVDDETVLEGASTTLEPRYFARGQRVQVLVTPADPYDEGPTVSSPIVVVGNSRPEAPTLTILPERPRAGEPLACTIAAPSFNADDDPITYRFAWLLDGEPTEHGAEGDHADLPAELTSPWQVWTCQATPTDGLGEGAPSRVDTWIRADWIEVATGGGHTCAIRDDATLWCWGANGSGQLGDGTTTSATRPVAVLPDHRWDKVAAGLNATCAIRDDATLWCWGGNNMGQLGNGGFTTSLEAVKVGGDARWTHVSVGYHHTCGVREDRSLWCWGWAGNGQIGDGSEDRESRPEPTPVRPDLRWSSVQAGYVHTCGVDADGRAWCWGWGLFGQLGIGTFFQHAAPMPVAGGLRFVEIGVGWGHSCGLTAGGDVWCWGRNRDFGQLGIGLGPDRPSPVRAALETPATSLTVGFYHACVTADDEAVCWGQNTEGQLGDGSRADRDEPTATGIVADRVVTGWYHTCALSPVASLDCWGNNDSGQLGDDTVERRLSPVEVLAP